MEEEEDWEEDEDLEDEEEEWQFIDDENPMFFGLFLNNLLIKLKFITCFSLFTLK